MSITLTKNVIRSSTFYQEDVIVAAIPYESPFSFLDITSCGHSFFRSGAVIPIHTGAWSMQLQTDGHAGVVLAGGETFHLIPGDVLAIPPQVSYEYRVPAGQNMRKEFLCFRPGSFLEVLLGREIRENGPLVRCGEQEQNIPPLFFSIRKKMECLTYETLEDLSTELYRLCYRLRERIAAHSFYGDFDYKLRAAANDLGSMNSLDDLSRKFGLGKYSLIRAFHKKTGKPPMKFMIETRLKQSQQFLMFSSMPIAEIAYSCGYTSPSFFASEFKKHFGMTPREFRKQPRKKT